MQQLRYSLLIVTCIFLSFTKFFSTNTSEELHKLSSLLDHCSFPLTISHFLIGQQSQSLVTSHAINHVSLKIEPSIELSDELSTRSARGAILPKIVFPNRPIEREKEKEREREKKKEKRNVAMPRSNRNTGRFCYHDETACASGRQTAFVSYFLPSRRSKAHVAGDSRLVIRQGNERRRPNDPHRRGGYSLSRCIYLESNAKYRLWGSGWPRKLDC